MVHFELMNNAILCFLSFSVELLAYKVEQEKCIASDLQKTLTEEQERARNVRQLLAVEQSAVQDLQSELRKCQQENTRLLESLSEAQREVLQLRCGPAWPVPFLWKSCCPWVCLGWQGCRSLWVWGLGISDGATWIGRGGGTPHHHLHLCLCLTWHGATCSLHRSLLDGKERDLKAALEELEQEQGKKRALQAQQEEEQLRHLQREGQSSKALEVPAAQAIPASVAEAGSSSHLPSFLILICESMAVDRSLK